MESACCGMAGAFGYGRGHLGDIAQDGRGLAAAGGAGERRADTLIVADGTSCRHQIELGAGRNALHVSRVLAMAIARERVTPS